MSGITVNGESGLRIASRFYAPPFAAPQSALVLGVRRHGPESAPAHSRRHAHGPGFSVLVGGGSGVVAFGGAGVRVHIGARATEGCPCAVEGSISATAALASDMRRLHIDSLIFVVSNSSAGIAAASGFDVTFAQSVPEPSIVLLLVSGAGLITAMAHKVRRA